MKQLEASIKRLQASLAVSELDASLGQTTPLEIENVGKTLPLTDLIRKWYLNGAPYDFRLPWLLEELCLFSPHELEQGQVGYRWTGEIGGDHCEDWEPQWLVIGTNSADPIIADTSDPETPILMAFHGTGFWSPQRIADSLPEFLDMLATWVEVYGYYEGQIFDEEGEVNSSLLEDFRRRLTHVLSDKCMKNFSSFWI